MFSFITQSFARSRLESGLRGCGLRHSSATCNFPRRTLYASNKINAEQDVKFDKLRQIWVPSFPNRASGEWFGHEVSFSARTGAPLNIEDRFVPDAYREWDVEIKGFDTVTSTKVTESVYQKRTRALPSVGCEADAVVPDTVAHRYEHVFGFADGSFSSGPFHSSETNEWSFTVVDPNDERYRARVEFAQSDGTDRKISVVLERWEAEFCDGQVLPGCGGSTGFANENPMDLDDLNGTWHVCSEIYSNTNAWQPVQTECTYTRNDMRHLISTALPLGLSVGIRRSERSLNIAVGWLRGNHRVVLQRAYAEDGALVSVSRELEIRQE